MLQKTFKGGVHPRGEKDLAINQPIEETNLPKQVVIPLSQHVGAPCRPLVQKGDLVKVGQKIGDSDKFISAPVHSSISGTVKAVEKHLVFSGQKTDSVIIDSDGKQDVFDSIKPYPVLEKISADEIIKAVREAGIVGMGGAAFPTYVKLSPPPGKKIDSIIINAAECEPYLNADYRLMLEDVFNIAYGIDVIKKVLAVTKVYVGVEDNKPIAIDYLAKKLNRVEIVKLHTKYPQGGEKQIIKTILNREVPMGGLPADVGVAAFNVATCAQIAKTLKTGFPLIERVVTVSGKHLRKPSNLKVRIGTLYKEIIEQCGGVDGELAKVVCGGPMMGIAVPSLDVPVQKGTSGIIVFTKEEIAEMVPEVCIRCGKCSQVCPMNLNPNFLADYAERGDWKKCKELGALNCIECGCCSYICGSRRDIVQLIKLAKKKLT